MTSAGWPITGATPYTYAARTLWQTDNPLAGSRTEGNHPIGMSVPAIKVVDVGAGHVGRPGITSSKGGEDELHDGLA